MRRQYKIGDWVIYRKQKHSTQPGPRAQDVSAAPKGEEYHYVVDKFWIVADVAEAELTVRTRRGKQHVLAADDPNLRHARWWERLVYRQRFVEIGNA